MIDDGGMHQPTEQGKRKLRNVHIAISAGVVLLIIGISITLWLYSQRTSTADDVVEQGGSQDTDIPVADLTPELTADHQATVSEYGQVRAVDVAAKSLTVTIDGAVEQFTVGDQASIAKNLISEPAKLDDLSEGTNIYIVHRDNVIESVWWEE